MAWPAPVGVILGDGAAAYHACLEEAEVERLLAAAERAVASPEALADLARGVVGMTEVLTLPSELAGPLEAVTDADRAWFETHLHRCYRLRPTALGELMPGEAMAPGSRTLVIRCGDPGVRFRLHVGRPPAHLRRDTDRCGRLLIERLTARGLNINDRPLVDTLAAITASVSTAIRQHSADQGRNRDLGDRP